MREIDFSADYPIYELSGDALICEKALLKIKEHYGIGEMSTSVFNEENFDLQAIINSANQFSFFDEKRLVVIKNIENALTKDEQMAFNQYIGNPNQNAIIVIVNTCNSNAFDFIKDKKVIDCKADDLFSFKYIKDEFEKQGKVIEQPQVKKLAQFCLNDMVRIKQEISKICSYLQTGNLVTDDVIDKLVTPDEELNVFALIDALSKKDAKSSHTILYDMQQNGEPSIKLLGLISGHFRRLFFAKISKNKTNAQLASELGCKEYAIVKAKQQSEKFSASQLKQIENLILETDYNIKSGKMSQENAMYYLIFKITNM